MPGYITVNDASYCESHGNAADEWITQVDINGTVNNSGSSGSVGYEDFTGVSFMLPPGNNYSFALTPAFSGRNIPECWQIWIDLNQDGDFDDSGEQVFSIVKVRNTVTGSITIPADASGITRMRITMNRDGLVSPCAIFSRGEVEDYTVQISAPVEYPPVAAFVGNPTTIDQGQSVQFTDLSTENPTSWSWSFPGGTPSSSTDQNPVVTYDVAGVYDVTLVATNAAGSDTETKTSYITVNVPPPPVADFSGNPTTIDQGQSVQFTDLSTGNPTSWSWSFEGGTPATSTEQNPTVTYYDAGAFDVTLIVTNANGSDTKTNVDYIAVNVVIAPVANFTSDKTNIYVGESVQFSDMSLNNPTSWSWSFPGGTPAASTEQNPLVAYYGTGSYDVFLTVSNAGGSSQKAEFLYINVTNPPPPPGCASVVAPLDNATGVPVTTTLQWSAVSGATGYIIYFGTDNPPTNLENGTDLGNVTSYDPAGDLNYSAAYNWRIVPYNTYGTATGCPVWSFSTEASPFGSVELSFTDFESGWGIWTDGGVDCALYTGGTYASGGSNAADIQDCTGIDASFYMTDGEDVATPGYQQIDVEFEFIAIDLDNWKDDFWVQYFDGSAWHTVATYALGAQFSNGIFYAAGVSILESAYAFPTNMKIRFMCDTKNDGDDVYIDNVRISAGTAVNPNNYIVPLSRPTDPAIVGNGADHIRVYPSPAYDNINVEILEGPEAEVYINDMQGKVVHHSRFNDNHKAINIEGLRTGLYTILVITPDHFIRTIFIKR
jgi:PKD repeat protein